jgi:hypothetical protein
MRTLIFTRASHEPGKHGQPCHITNVAKVAVVAGSVCPRPENRRHNPADDIRCTIIDTGTPDGCWHVREPVEQVLAAIEREKARALGCFNADRVPAIESLERRVASLEEDRNRRDELDAAAVVALQRMRG